LSPLSRLAFLDVLLSSLLAFLSATSSDPVVDAPDELSQRPLASVTSVTAFSESADLMESCGDTWILDALEMPGVAAAGLSPPISVKTVLLDSERS
jgi:hypothetical protein